MQVGECTRGQTPSTRGQTPSTKKSPAFNLKIEVYPYFIQTPETFLVFNGLI